MRKKITLEDLASMTQRGFAEVLEKTASKQDLARLEKRVVNIEERMATKEDLRALAGSWAQEVFRLEDQVKGLQKRVAVLEGKRRRAA